MKHFHELNLPQALLKALEKMQFTTPTPIQAQTIPIALKEGQDILGTAQTGTGKTGAFAIPLCAKLMNHKDEAVLVLTPTRELALQVITVFHQLLSFDRSIKSALLIGGEPIDKQFRQLKRHPRLIVGTPGRINDHLSRGTLQLTNTSALVLDETDLMLDMGFDIQIATIIERMPNIRQTLMFSATLPKRIAQLAGKYLKTPARVSIGVESTPQKDITQEVIKVADKDKYAKLLQQLKEREGSIIVFVKTRDKADKLSFKLYKEGFRSAAIHGNLRQSKRQRVLKGFRSEKYRILVATDVASRGIDVPHIRHVINYDLPQCAEDYIHRIGRTARAGEKGDALSFVTKQNQHLWDAIQRLLDPNAKRESPPKRRKPSSKNRSSFFSKRAKQRRHRR